MYSVRGRNADLLTNVNNLQKTLRQTDQDSTDVLKYLENEVRRKDILTKKLGKEIRELYQQQLQEKNTRNQQYTKEIAELETVFAQKEAELLQLNRVHHQEYNDLLLFAQIRTELQSELLATKAIILRNEKRHALQMADLEKKFILARNKLLKESEERIAESRKNYKEEVGRELDLESKYIQMENKKMKGELEFHQTLIEKLQTSNEELLGIVKELERSVNELEKKDQNYASNSLRNTKVLHELDKKHQILTASIKEVDTHTQSQKSEEKSSAVKNGLNSLTPFALQEASLHAELEKLSKFSLLRAQENEALYTQIQTLRAQRNDVELFFLEALQSVKMEVALRRKRIYEADMRAYEEKLQQLGEGLYQPRGIKHHSNPTSTTLRIASDPRLPPPPMPQCDASKISVSELSLKDKEKVLQILFEKLNAQTVFQQKMGAASNAQHHQQQQHDTTALSFPPSRASSALSLYTGRGDASSGSTSLVVSRPQSSTRTRSRPSSSQRQHPHASSSVNKTFVTQTDLRPTDAVQFGSTSFPQATRTRTTSAGNSRRSATSRLKQTQSAQEEKDGFPSFFPPRGDTPTELL